jgi:HrpA-like RNA helicase
MSINFDNKIGILDTKGIYLNPLTNKEYSDEYRNLANIWSKFPAYENAIDIMKEIINNQVILIISGTGSGKTVLLPKYVLHVLNYNKKIAITLPKQIIAKSAAEYAAKTLDVKLGDAVGYQYKGASEKTNNTKLLYATDGTIVSRLLKDPLLKEYDAVIIDEAHERKVQIDFLLYLLKNVVKNRPEFKLVIMSATVNEEIFKTYFTNESFKVVNIGAKTNYPIESIFLSKSIEKNDYLEKGYEILKQIIKQDDLTKNTSHDILFFITSANEAIKICEKISKDKEINEDNLCIEVYAGMDNDKQLIAQDKNLYKTKYNKKRKIVLATNVAESSLTIDGIKYVIDSGLEFHSYYEPEYNCKVLDKQLITQAQAKQRMGRAGRTEMGYCYHLYTKEDFEHNMIKFPEPTIKISNITSETLQFLTIPEIGTYNNLLNIYSQFIEPPTEKFIRASYYQLQNLGLITNNKISQLGLLVNDIGLDVQLSIACIIGKKLRCFNEVLAICCCLEVGKYNMTEFFKSPNLSNNQQNQKQIDELKNKIKTAKNTFVSKYGDLTSLLKIFIKVYEAYKNKKINDVCSKFYLNYNTWYKICTYYDRYFHNLRYKLKSINEITAVLNIDQAIRINTCFYTSYKENKISQVNNDKYNNTHYGLNNIKLSDNSYNYNTQPSELYYIELIKNMGRYEVSITNIIGSSTHKLYDIVYKTLFI